MSEFIDMTGWVMSEHGVPDSRLTVIQRVEDHIYKNGRHEIQWLCECNCQEHNQIVVFGSALRFGNTKSCGCFKREKMINNNKNNKKYNEYELNLQDEHGEYGIGYCSNTGRPFYFDMEDYNKIKDHYWGEWSTDSSYHVLQACPLVDKNENRRSIRMHVLIGCKNYDHEDRNPFNNRKYNLRLATRQENARNKSLQINNTSGVSGVSWDKYHKVWRARINYRKNTNLNIGSFKEKEDAIRARLNAELKYFGEFAPQRYLFEEYNIT